MTTAKSTGRGESERLGVGFHTSLSAGNLRVSLTEVGQRFPLNEIEMLESSRRCLVTALRNAVVDIGIVPGATSLPETNTMSLWSERIMIAVPESHTLAAKEVVYWIDLRDERLVLSRQIRDRNSRIY